MVMPIIIGLPGVGKSEVNRALAQRLDVRIISTEQEFRRLRSIGANDDNPDSAHINAFIKQVYYDFVITGKMTPFQFARLRRVCNIDKDDLKQGNKFHKKDILYSFGMDVFRTFENVVIKAMFDQEYYSQGLREVPEYAFTRPEIRKIFEAQSDFVPVLLNADHEVIVDKLMADFDQHVELSLKAQNIINVRGDYDLIGREAFSQTVESLQDDANSLYLGSLCAGATRDFSLITAWLEASSEARNLVRESISKHAMEQREQYLPSLHLAAKVTIDMNGAAGGQIPVDETVDRIMRELNLG